MNRFHLASTALVLGMMPGMLMAWPFGDGDPASEKREMKEAREAALERLYREEPASREEIKRSQGYAVFSNMGLNLGIVSSQSGAGILRDNRSGVDIYMNMFSAGGGFGLGVKDYSAVFIFEDAAALDRFMTEGWDFSGQVETNLELDSESAGAGVALSAMPGVILYQLTETGVAVQATLHGTRFWVDEDLN